MDGDLTKRQIKRLRKKSSLFVKDTFCIELQRALEKYGLDSFCSIEPQQDGEGDGTYPEPRRVFVKYRSAWVEPLGDARFGESFQSKVKISKRFGNFS